jgi:putative ABC transport system permease protein
MRNVKNKKCIDNLCKKSIYANVRRNVILTFAIILSTMMLTTLFTVSGSIIESVEQSTLLQVGTTSHAGFKFMTEEEFEILKTDSGIRDLSYNVIVGSLLNDELYEDYTEIRYTTDECAKTSFSYPEVGRLPEDMYEIATCTEVLDDFGLPYELGETLHLIIYDGETVREFDFVLSGYWEKPAATLANQIYVSKQFQEAYAPAWKDADDKEAHLMNQSYTGAINPDFNFPSKYNLEGQMENLKERLGFGPDVNDGINWAYATAKTDPTSIIMIAFILILIMGSGYLIIYNIFCIAVSSDIRYYGLLKTVGTTNKQLKRLIVRQAVLLAVIGIPVGMVFGYLVSVVLLPVITENMLDVSCEIHPSILIFVLSALFSWITIRISCIKPCKVVKKISPVEAVRYSEYTGANLSKKKKISKVTPFSMARENLKRNKKKSFVVVLSLSLSILMINVTVSITRSFDKNKYISNFAASDFTVSEGSLMNRNYANEVYDGVSQADIETLSSIPGITDIGASYMMESLQHVEGDAYDRMVALYEAHLDWFVYNDEARESYDKWVYDDKVMGSHVYGADELVFDNMDIDSGDLNWEKFSTGKYVIASASVQSGHDDSEYAVYRIGDKVNVYFEDGTCEEYEVMAIGDLAYSMGPQHSHGMDVYFTLPADEYLRHASTDGAMKLFFDVEEGAYQAAEEFVDEYCSVTNPGLAYESRETYLEDFEDMVNVFLIVGGALSLILALIGILNFVNLTYTSIHERKKELEVLRAIGMTRKQQKSMLIGEGLIHIILTFSLVLTVGMLLNYLIVNLIAGGMIMFSYKFVIWPVLACIPVFAIVAAGVPVAVIRSK